MEELDTKQSFALIQAIQSLKTASDLLCGNFRATQYAEMMSEFSNNCDNMVEELEWVIENEIEEEANPHLTSNA